MNNISEVEMYELQSLLAMVWDTARVTGDYQNCHMYLMGMIDMARHTVGWGTELVSELQVLEDMARAQVRTVQSSETLWLTSTHHHN
jgi:hypothetical protein